jgi:ADP-heptose:LPS heptosyltransferase
MNPAAGMQGARLSGFYGRSRTAGKILALDLGFLGDSVHLVPALWEIKRHYPEAELHTLSAPVGAEVLKLAPCVSRAWGFPLGAPSPPWWRHWDVIGALRRQRFDLVFNFSGADRSVFITALTGAKWRVAYAGGRWHFWNPWLIRDWLTHCPSDFPVYEQRRKLLAACGLDLAPARWDLHLPEAAKARAEALVADGAIHFSVNASTPLNEWPMRHWIDLAKSLLTADPGLRIVATASTKPRETERVQALVQGVGDNRLTGLPSGLAIAELAAVLKRCRVHVGGDSGVIHLATALDVPTVGLFRDYAGTKWVPRGPAHRHLMAPCPCGDVKTPPCAGKTEAECLAQITPGQVMALMHPPVQGVDATPLG